MKHPEFKWVNVAFEGVFNRKFLPDINKLGSPEGKEETYATYFRYDEDMHNHFHKIGSVKGFKGKAYADWLPIDIDSDDLEEAQMYLIQLINNLAAYDIDESTCKFYFSGSKGFHVMIPTEYFKAEPSEDIHKRMKNVALKLSDGIKIDTAIYDKTRIFRLPNTRHGKSGLYKVPIESREARNLSIIEIQHHAVIPREEIETDDYFDPSKELTEIYHGEIEQNKKVDNDNNLKVKVKICMSTLMKGVGSGERDNVGVRVASHLTQSGLTPKMMQVALDEWNESNDPPLDDGELSRIFRQGLEGYEFGCFDDILKVNCNKECIFYKEEWRRF